MKSKLILFLLQLLFHLGIHSFYHSRQVVLRVIGPIRSGLRVAEVLGPGIYYFLSKILELIK